MLISEEYREQNRQLHAKRSDYGAGNSPTNQIRKIAEMIVETGIKDVLDYGCGKGMLGRLLPFPIKEYDPAIPGKDGPAEPAEMVICRDVLEHIEPECIDAVLDDLARVTKRFGYFVVALGPSTDQLPDGRNAHILQRAPEWWQEKMKARFNVLQMEHHGGYAMITNGFGYWPFEEVWVYVKSLHRLG